MKYYKLSVEECFENLQSRMEGLSRSEVDERLAEYGKNEIIIKGKSFWKKLSEPFKDIFMAVLLFAVVISLVKKENIDAVIIGVIVFVDAGIYYIQQFSTDRVLKSLQKKNSLMVDAIRDNQMVKVDSINLVPGDIIVIEEGDKIPADCRLISVDSLRVDESQMTGESLPVEKDTGNITDDKDVYDQSNMVFNGSFVVGGQAKAMVINTGNNTEYGKLAKLSVSSNNESPVQKRINKLISIIVKVIAVVAAIAFALSLYRGMSISDAIRYVLALSVSAVPEGLPVAITVILVLGMRRMAKKKALVKNQPAIETVGIVTTIATDKTGTLTKNMLTVQKTWQMDDTLIDIKKAISHSLLPAISKSRDPLDLAMENYLAKSEIINREKISMTLPFSQQYAMSGNLIHTNGSYELFIKGAPEKVIELCHFEKTQSNEIRNQVLSMAASGLRVLALAHIRINNVLNSFEEIDKKEVFEFDGLIGVADVLRNEATAAIKRAHSAGIKVCMVTGDHFETAYNIGKQLGIVDDRSEVLDSSLMRDMTDKELLDSVDKIRVYARVTPENKHRLLSILKQTEITAMTGDGVNDVPALTNAHVGVAMGSGTSIAKDAGDIILLDDNFRSIVDAVHEGRTVYANIKRMVAYLLSTNAGEVLLALGALIIGAPIPLMAVQILWVNLVTDTCMVIPLGLEPGEKRNMLRPPIKPNASLFSKFMISRIMLTTITMAAISLWLYLRFIATDGVDYARTITFNALVVMQWASAINSRSDYEPLYKRILKISWPFIIGLAIAVVSQVFAITGFLHNALHIKVTPNMNDLVMSTLLAFVIPIVVIEIHKWIGRKFFNKGREVKRK